MRWLTHGSGGISGGGLLEWQRQSAKHVLPAAIIFAAKVVLSNLSYAHAALPIYMLSRIAIVPLTLVLTAALMKQSHSVQTLSSTLIATFNLFMAIIRSGDRVTLEPIIAGVFSSFFAALFPIALLRAYRKLVADLIPQGDVLIHSTHDDDDISVGCSKEETRAYWRTLHYTSLLSIAILVPIVIISGEVNQIYRNCYFLDVPWFWFLMVCGGLASWAVFVSTLLLLKATSVLTVAFVGVPRSAFQIVVLGRGWMGVHNWVGVGLCWASCLWYLGVRVREGRYRVGGIEAR